MTGPVGDDEFRTYDAAYVLGALTPAERHDYEQHLADCPRCREAVRSFAGLPGLLSRIPVEDFTTPAEEPPPDLLPRLLATAAHRRRRARWYVTAGAAVAAAVCLVFALVLGIVPGGAPSPPPGRTMTAVASAPVQATVALHSQPWGTEVNVRCRYNGPAAYPGGYTLVVVDRAGHTDQISSWDAIPATTAVLHATTSLHRNQIRAVQVRTDAGTAVLTLNL